MNKLVAKAAKQSARVYAQEFPGSALDERWLEMAWAIDKRAGGPLRDVSSEDYTYDEYYTVAKTELARLNVRYGIYPHAEWDGAKVVQTYRGYVVREVGDYVPYGRMEPVAVYKRESAAQKRCDKLNGMGR